MKRLPIFAGKPIAALIAALAVAMPAFADQPANILTLNLIGDDNVLYATQDLGPMDTGGWQANSMTISIEGDRNGGARPGWTENTPLIGDLMPGQLTQVGFDNSLTLSVSGNDNRFATFQTGESNRVSGTIAGDWNQAAVYQAGLGNTAVFSQTGQRNTIVVSQRSW